MTLRVAVDVTPELTGRTGVARYSRELTAALVRRGNVEVIRFAVGRGVTPAGVDARHLRVPLRLAHPVWRLAGYPAVERLTGPVDLVHSLDLLAPPTRAAVVMSVHDVVTVELPELHPPRNVRMQRRRLEQLQRADAVVSVSRTTAARVVELGVPQSRVHVAPNGLSALPAPVDPPVPARPFVLVVGTLEPRKGHDRLLRACARARLGPAGLVFAGPTAGRSRELLELASQLDLAGRLTILGHVDDRVLAGLYRDATLLCVPSLAEGFGLPMLEAMAAGLPVLASDLPVVREVAGNAAIVFPAGDEAALAGALERVLADTELRARASALGRARAAEFTWDATAAATIKAYEAALALRRGP